MSFNCLLAEEFLTRITLAVNTACECQLQFGRSLAMCSSNLCVSDWTAQ